MTAKIMLECPRIQCRSHIWYSYVLAALLWGLDAFFKFSYSDAPACMGFFPAILIKVIIPLIL
ncbi:hypothetical protein F5Y16DRAFT_367217 [Xylariaceae sp. FL0255]|nr:hypothetical protein F5Y16DRAFT_367217 [Xylariaceae sp. FL0255]